MLTAKTEILSYQTSIQVEHLRPFEKKYRVVVQSDFFSARISVPNFLLPIMHLTGYATFKY